MAGRLASWQLPPRLADLFSSLLQACEKAGEDLVPCEGQCCGMFHLQCLGMMELEDKWLCQECSTGETAGRHGFWFWARL